jgi:hypothetical protein
MGEVAEISRIITNIIASTRILCKLVSVNMMLLENVSAVSETFRQFFMTVQEYFIDYCRCRGSVKLFRFLLPLHVQRCTELHFSLISREEEPREFAYYFGGWQYYNV